MAREQRGSIALRDEAQTPRVLVDKQAEFRQEMKDLNVHQLRPRQARERLHEIAVVGLETRRELGRARGGGVLALHRLREPIRRPARRPGCGMLVQASEA